MFSMMAPPVFAMLVLAVVVFQLISKSSISIVFGLGTVRLANLLTLDCRLMLCLFQEGTTCLHLGFMRSP